MLSIGLYSVFSESELTTKVFNDTAMHMMSVIWHMLFCKAMRERMIIGMHVYGGSVKRAVSVFLAVISVLLLMPVPKAAAQTPELPAKAVVLMEYSSGEVLAADDAHEKLPCASITKVMTLLLVFEAIEQGVLRYEDILTASAHAAGMGGSDIWLREGEQMSVDDLIKACVVMSANDAAVVLAEAISGTEEAFVARMNERAQELGMHDTVFKNCNGLDEEGHLTSAYDVAIMSRALMAHERIFDYTLIWIDYVRGGDTQLVNTNKLVRSYKGIKGLKTGTTGAAGSCISACAERNGMTLIAVVLGAENTNDRFSAAASLMDYGFSNWKTVKPESPELPVLPVRNGMEDTVQAVCDAPSEVLVPVSGASSVEVKIQLPEELSAPVEAGQQIGKLCVLLNGDTVEELPIKAENGVEAITFKSAFQYVLRNFFGCTSSKVSDA